MIGLLVAEDVDTEMLYFNVVGDVAQNIVGLVRVNDTAMNITLLSQLDREVGSIIITLLSLLDSEVG